MSDDIHDEIPSNRHEWLLRWTPVLRQALRELMHLDNYTQSMVVHFAVEDENEEAHLFGGAVVTSSPELMEKATTWAVEDDEEQAPLDPMLLVPGGDA